jgi:UrcA family protein
MTHNAYVFRRVSERVTSAAAAIAMTALLAMASDARAETMSVQVAPSVSIAYSSAEVTTEKGAANLYRKLKRAARTVCDAYGGDSLQRRVAAQKCFDKSLANAVQQVNAQPLTALHLAATRDLG